MSLIKEDLELKMKSLIKEKISTISYTSWIETLEIKEVVENNIVILTTSEFHQDMIVNKYIQLIEETIVNLTNKNWNINIIEKKGV